MKVGLPQEATAATAIDTVDEEAYRAERTHAFEIAAEQVCRYFINYTTVY